MTVSTDIGRRWVSEALGLATAESPFPWQLRLVSAFLAEDSPSALDIPTGLGKTSVMAIWLVARALGAPVPRRLVYVVDRRAVVDQATAVAESLQSWVRREPAVQDALGLAADLPISTLRGQHADNRAWLADPGAPAIVVGTVDMVGSRLLFGGYGVSHKMRPYHAGLLGADALIVLDEAHLAPAFERLLAQIDSGVDADGRSLIAAGVGIPSPVPSLRLLTLSATGRQRSGGRAFALDADDLWHSVVRRRLEAPKRIRLFDAVEAKELPDVLAAHAWNLCAEGRKSMRVMVFVNSREHAQKVQAALLKLSGKSGRAAVELFVGGRRHHERQAAADRLAALGFIAGAAATLDRPAFVVATSAGEVGVDLDADHAVCDLVAWERMVQRLGRVNRRGEGDASVMVVPARFDEEVIQARQAAVLELLARLPLTEDGARDGSPAALTALRQTPDAQVQIERASTPAPLHPPLTRALVEAWAMTSLEQHTGRPEVDPWLRGWPDEPEQPQVAVIWRTRLPVNAAGQALTGASMELFLDAAGPHMVERLESDLSRVGEWLLKRGKSLIDKPAPSDGGTEGAEASLGVAEPAFVLVDDKTGHARVLSAEVAASATKRDIENWLRGATVWADARVGGLTDGLLDDGADAIAPDVTELVYPDGARPVPFMVGRCEDAVVPPPAAGWRLEAAIPVEQSDDGVTGWLIVTSLVSDLAGSEEGRSGAQRAQLLSDHQDWAEEAARAIAQSHQLPQPYTEMLMVAARVHDEGKQTARWQRAFHAPDRGRPPYAKTVGRPDVALLDGYRHEFGSLPYAEAHPRVQALPPDLRELCLHLIAAHHGGARPVIGTRGADEPPSRAQARARAVALRYASLSERWGPWGLAWWESLLRAADQQASRRNDEEGGRRG